MDTEGWSSPDKRFEQDADARRLLAGAVAGIASALVFALVHDLLISDIWSTAPMMSFAGGICGVCLVWSYDRLPGRRSAILWIGYNGAYLVMFGLLGVASVVYFTPVTTMAAILADGGPVDELIVQALPMTALFTFIAAAVITLLFGRSWSVFGPVLATTAVLVLFLGLNVSAIGLVDFAGGSVFLVVELFALIVVLAVVFAFGFLGTDALLKLPGGGAAVPRS